MVKVGFFGASGEVTGSNFLVDTGENKYVVDCGLFQGKDSWTSHNNEPFAYNPAELKAVIITHAHLDHIGRLPCLVRGGFRGPIYATPATAELTAIVLKDALHIMQSNFERENEPMLYEDIDLSRTLEQMRPVKYRTKQTLTGEDSVTFYDAGHILGSASVSLSAGGKTLVFSGDLGNYPNTLLPKFDPPPLADLVVTEATYAGVTREAHEDRLVVIKSAIDYVLARRGVLMIPAFSVERSQELLYLLHHLFKAHQLPHIPIYLDSPLAIEALDIFKRHTELYAAEIQQERRQDSEIFNFGTLALTATGEESRQINEAPLPKIIIAGSGMMAGGRIFHHLKRYLSRADSLLLVVGYQAEGTLGRTITEGANVVEISGDHIPVHCKVEVVDIFSGHADNTELLEWLKAIKLNEGGKVAIVHSEADRAKTYKEELVTTLPGVDTVVAEIGTTLEV